MSGALLSIDTPTCVLENLSLTLTKGVSEILVEERNSDRSDEFYIRTCIDRLRLAEYLEGLWETPDDAMSEDNTNIDRPILNKMAMIINPDDVWESEPLLIAYKFFTDVFFARLDFDPKVKIGLQTNQNPTSYNDFLLYRLCMRYGIIVRRTWEGIDMYNALVEGKKTDVPVASEIKVKSLFVNNMKPLIMDVISRTHYTDLRSTDVD